MTHVRVPPGVSWQGTFPCHLFSLTLDGGALYQLPEGPITVGRHEVLSFAPHAWQDWQALPSCGWEVYYLIVVLPAALHELVQPPSLAPGIGRIQVSAEDAECVANAFRTMLEWDARPSPMGARIIFNQLEYILLLLQDRQPQAQSDPRVYRARHFLHQSLETRITLADVARAACLSRARLCALFKEEIGSAPMQYLEGLRLEQAARLLLFTADPVDAIAQRFGYAERKYFDKRFKRCWGETPCQYRRRGRQANP